MWQQGWKREVTPAAVLKIVVGALHIGSRVLEQGHDAAGLRLPVREGQVAGLSVRRH